MDLPDIRTSQEEVNKKISLSNISDGVIRGVLLPVHNAGITSVGILTGGLAGMFAGGALGSLFNLASSEPGFKLIETFANYGALAGAGVAGLGGAGASMLMMKDQLGRSVPNGRLFGSTSQTVPFSEDSPSYKAGIVAGVSLTLAVAAGAGKAIYNELKIESDLMQDSQVQEIYESSSSDMPSNITFDKDNSNYIIETSPPSVPPFAPPLSPGA